MAISLATKLLESVGQVEKYKTLRKGSNALSIHLARKKEICHELVADLPEIAMAMGLKYSDEATACAD